MSIAAPARAALFAGGALLVLAMAAAPCLPAFGAVGGAKKIEAVCRTLTGDANYKVRVQAALVLGKMADPDAVTCLARALIDPNRTVRAVAAEVLGQLGSTENLTELRGLVKNDPDPFVRSQAEKAAALLLTRTKATGPAQGGGGRPKIFLAFGPFSGGVKAAVGDPVRIVHDTLQTELSKLPSVTVAAGSAPTGKAGGAAFWIDGNISRLDDVAAGAGSETSCGVKVMVARWPSKSIISWTSAEASVQAGSRPRDRENARRECLEATASQLAEDLAKFLKAQGG